MTHASIAFRVDASLAIGAGHVMRCLSLADALHAMGAHCRFICRAHEGHLGDVIHDRGFRLDLLSPEERDAQAAARADWLGASWQQDAASTLHLLEQDRADWLVVDHYALDARWERTVRGASRSLMVIDDLADRPHDCDLLLDQNLGSQATSYQELVPAHCHLLIGPGFALLQPQFSAHRPSSLRRREVPVLERLLVTMGGVDQPNVTDKVLQALQVSRLGPECEVLVVMGPHAPWTRQIRERAATLPFRTDVLVGVKNMAQLMAEADLAIGAAGSTAWERCALGLPTCMVVIAPNQKNAAQALASAGGAELISMDDLPEVLAQRIDRFIQEPWRLSELSGSAARICDGLGAERVASSILARTSMKGSL